MSSINWDFLIEIKNGKYKAACKDHQMQHTSEEGQRLDQLKIKDHQQTYLICDLTCILG